MSILSEYEQIRKDLGEEVYQKIELFLLTRPDLYLSDVLYREKIWKQFELECFINKEIESYLQEAREVTP